MNLRQITGFLIIYLMLGYSIGGLCANAVPLNNSGILNESITNNNFTYNRTINKNITVAENTTINTNESNPLNYSAYPLNCPKWDDYKNKHPSPIQNFGDYLDDLKIYVANFTTIDDYNIQQSKMKYDNNSGYFSGNPTYGDYDYRYMPTSELNNAYVAGSIAKSRISLPDALSSELHAQYTVASVILGIMSGICGVCSAVAGLLTAGTAGGASPILVVFVAITASIVVTTVAISTCLGVVTQRSAGITVERGKMDNRLYLMNAELMYRASLPKQDTQTEVTAINTTPLVVVNKTNTTFNDSYNAEIPDNITEECATTTNTTNRTEEPSGGNVYGVNDVPPSQKPIPGDVKVIDSGTYMDQVGDIDISGFPQKPPKPHPKWYQFWLWIDYGFKCTEWAVNVVAWGFKHIDSLNNVISLCKEIQSESNNC